MNNLQNAMHINIAYSGKKECSRKCIYLTEEEKTYAVISCASN